MPTYRTVFMSHAHLDNAICARYATALRAKGIDVWIDLNNAQVGHDLTEDIDRELKRCAAFVLMVTKHSNASHWVKQERGAYNALMNTPHTRVVNGVERMVLPVRLEDEVPAIFGGIHWVDALHLAFDQAVEAIAYALVVAAVQPQPQAPLLSTPKPDGSPVFTRRAVLVGSISAATAAALGGGFYWLAHDHSTGKSLGTSTVTSTPRPTSVTESLVPASLIPLGFVGREYGGVKVIVPPVVSVPAGPFLMGSDPAKDPQAFSEEEPQSIITIAQAYQIGTYHVTVAEYALAVQAHAVIQPPDNGITWQAQLSQLDHPVVNVSWNNVLAYVRWLAQVTGQPWRLPTEAEWEKAARWDTTVNPSHARIYPWGDVWDKTRANTNDGGPGTTTPVGAYASNGDASPYGAHDMAGNVWEWCSTLYQSYPYSAIDGRENLDSTGGRVLRGGSWGGGPRDARAACRYVDGPSDIGDGVGARLARAVGAG